MAIEPQDQHPRLPTVRNITNNKHESFFGPLNNASGPNVPQTAPAVTKSFQPTAHVEQAHFRTRSVQGEPLSASLFSPISPLAPPSWIFHADQAQQMTIDPPTYNPSDATTWARRGFVQLHQPSSLPNDFAGHAAYLSSVSQGGSRSFPPVLSDDSPTTGLGGFPTVSPGVYHSGFSLPCRPPRMPSIPRSVPVQRPSRTSDSLYRPRTRPMTLPEMIPRGSEAKREGNSGGPHVDMGLPSSSLEGFHRHPFEGVVNEESADMGHQ